MDPLDALAADVREAGLVILAGAGVSMLAPSSLPTWRDFNRAVVTALAGRTARDTNRETVEDFLGGILASREVERVYAPDFMAQLIEEELGADYFRVLGALDSEAFNLNHALIAALARAGHLRAVVTTNFDRLIERALDAAGVAYRVFASSQEFHAMTSCDTLPVIKAHGSVERPDTMVDTLAQRVRGRPRALNDAVQALLARHAFLVIGFSGADLDYDPEYLALRASADSARRLAVLVRQGEEPLPAMRELLEAYGPRAARLESQLPGVLQALANRLGVPAPVPSTAGAVEAASLQAGLEAHARAWVDSLDAISSINAFIALVDANRDSPALLRFMLSFRRNHRTDEHTRDPVDWNPAYKRFEYRFARRLLDVGLFRHDPKTEFEEARRLFGTYAQFVKPRPDEDAMQRLGNLRDRGEPMYEAEAALSEWELWRYGPGRAYAHAMDVYRRWFENQPPDGHEPRATVDMCLALARVSELAGEYTAAELLGQVADESSRVLGDEPRRALGLILRARTLALTQRPEPAADKLAQAWRIARRLSLERVSAHALAAQGLLDVIASRDPEAIAPLREASALFGRSQCLPMVFVVLLDLCRAAFYTRDVDGFDGYQRTLGELCDRMPGAEGHLRLVQAETAAHRRDWEQLAMFTDALEGQVLRDPEYPWQWGLTRVRRHREALARHGYGA